MAASGAATRRVSRRSKDSLPHDIDGSEFEATAAEIVMIRRCWLSLVGYTSTIPEEYLGASKAFEVLYDA